MTLDDRFKKAADDAKNLEKTPNDKELLEIYALFKQGLVGNVNTEKPGLFDLKGKAKWEAWNEKKGTEKDAAKEAYISKVDTLIQAYGLKK